MSDWNKTIQSKEFKALTPAPDTASLRERVARIVDHEGCWTRLDALNGAIRLGLATDEQHLELCNARDEEISATECSLDTADAIIALIQPEEPPASVGEALASLEGAVRAASKGTFPYQGQYDALDDMEGLAHTLERHRTEPFFWRAPTGRDGT